MDFVNFDDAIKRLGVGAERLNQLREDGALRAYRDGASWKFRADEIDRMAAEGIPDSPPPSDIGLPSLEELIDAKSLGDLDSFGDDELKLVDEEQSELEVDLPDPDDTVTTGPNDALKLEEPSDPSDSILLSDETLGESPASPSTIIGRHELASQDADLELVTEDDLDDTATDVKHDAGASNVLTSGVVGSGVLDDVTSNEGNLSAFANLEELEIDLAAESSRVLNPAEADDLRAQVAAAGRKPADPDSDLDLADVQLAGEDEGTDPVPAELDKAADKKKPKRDAGPTSDLELATDEDDFVLADGSGSDITLDSADSGINLVDPGDSGLALDDIPLEIGGSQILASLSGIIDPKAKGAGKKDAKPGKGAKTAKPDSDLALMASDSGLIGGGAELSGVQTDDDFRLTPMGDGDDEDSSSQVIALDGGLGDLGAEGEGGLLEESAFGEELGGEAVDFGGDDAGMATAGFAGAAAPRAEGEYSMFNILALSGVMLLLMLGVIVSMDLMRNIWGWNENLALNDSLVEGILGLFGMR